MFFGFTRIYANQEINNSLAVGTNYKEKQEMTETNSNTGGPGQEPPWQIGAPNYLREFMELMARRRHEMQVARRPQGWWEDWSTYAKLLSFMIILHWFWGSYMVPGIVEPLQCIRNQQSV